MQSKPVAVLRDADIAHEAFGRIGLHNGYRKCQRTVGSSNGAAVAVGLLQVMVVLLDEDFVIRQQFDVIFYRSQIGGGQKYCFHFRRECF